MTTESKNMFILRTKLHRPPLPGDCVPRSGLVEFLNKHLDRPLILVTAPAGYGKSTLISSWFDVCGMPGAWLSLDRHDNDLRLFLTGMLETIKGIFSKSGRKLGTMLTAPTLPSMPVMAYTLINELDRIEQNFILALDDFHKINEKLVLEFLRELLRHPPRSMHLVIISRKDPFLPISSLRARNQLIEVRTRDLRFSESEVRQFLQLSLGGADYGAAATRLADQSEGWVTGIRLAVLASQKLDGGLSRLLELKGTTAYVREYLVQEVIDAQPEVIQRYLLSTSILERFNADLCHSLCSPLAGSGKDKTECADFVEKLKKENLFVVALDIEGRWFRYHHLFQDLLRKQLARRYSTDEIAVLHQRAGEWFEAQGLVGEAIGHALAAGCEDRAVQLVERHRQTMLDTDRHFVFEKWLSLLPDTLIEQHAELMLAQAWVHYFSYRFELIPSAIDRVEFLLDKSSAEHPLRGEISLFRGVMGFMRGDGIDSMQHIENALKLIPETHGMVRGFTEIYFGLAGQMTGQQERVVHTLSTLLSRCNLSLPRKLRVQTALVWNHLISGDCKIAASMNKQLMEAAVKNSAAPFISWSSYNQGLLHLRRNELDNAVGYFKHAAASGYLMLRRAAVDCLMGLMLAYEARREKDKADATLARLLKFVAPIKDPLLDELANSCKIRVSLMRGKSTFVCDKLHLDTQIQTGAMAIWLEVPVITQCKALLVRGSKTDLKQAEEKLAAYQQLNQSHHNTCHLVEILGLLAMVHEKQGNTEDAFNLLGQALTLARPGGLMFSFLEMGASMSVLLRRLQQRDIAVNQIEGILAAFQHFNPGRKPSVTAKPKPSSRNLGGPSPLVEPPTNRELEVLELLAQRLQTKEIADKLFISPETVRTHLRNIYQKLDVNNRRQATAKALEIGILLDYRK